MNEEQFNKMKLGQGFIAALDQSGGSTPKALMLYGIPEDAYSDDDEMFALVHQMRTRIITSPGFNGDRILGAILFEDTLDREIEGRGSADYLWKVKNVVPFLKVDKGLANEADGVQVMKPIPDLDTVLAGAVEKGVFGTKMRSFIKLANDAGVKAVVDQQFDLAHQILATGLVPIIEPEIDIHSPQKGEAESMLKGRHLRAPGRRGQRPVRDDQGVAAGSARLLRRPHAPPQRAARGRSFGGLQPRRSRYPSESQPRHDRQLLARPTEGLSVNQSDAEFNAALNDSIEAIYEASLT